MARDTLTLAPDATRARRTSRAMRRRLQLAAAMAQSSPVATCEERAVARSAAAWYGTASVQQMANAVTASVLFAVPLPFLADAAAAFPTP